MGELIWVWFGQRSPAAPSPHSASSWALQDKTNLWGVFPQFQSTQTSQDCDSEPVCTLGVSWWALPCFYGNWEAGPCLLCCIFLLGSKKIQVCSFLIPSETSGVYWRSNKGKKYLYKGKTWVCPRQAAGLGTEIPNAAGGLGLELWRAVLWWNCPEAALSEKHSQDGTLWASFWCEKGDIWCIYSS